MARKDRRGAATHNTDEVLTDKHGMCFVLPEGVSMEEALLAIGKLIGCENICAASRMNHKIIVFVSKVQLAHVVEQNGLVLGDARNVSISSWDTPASKILLSNVLPTLRKKFFKNSVRTVLWCRELLNLPFTPWMESLDMLKRLDEFAILL